MAALATGVFARSSLIAKVRFCAVQQDVSCVPRRKSPESEVFLSL
jgi:hypothetical protein